ncbi:hypothetical protein OV203_34085 [Nannocystis sp. ILAH1]|uniref:hypothetical protein n=1 Tax=unclassified Nannocystis TaxID=2627009 RepID=UPI00226FBED4|nr:MULTISPECIES: hypothetical protein [unclassified Nannocystis]MCY0992218.1 hypothetical protein [Nannocystis sp. ILAH1]MCY1069192.1 hypothetical protein [Nannocystis sp. RBIL2]
MLKSVRRRRDDDVAAGEHHLEDLQRELWVVAGGEALGLLADDDALLEQLAALEQLHVQRLVPLALGGQLVDGVRMLALGVQIAEEWIHLIDGDFDAPLEVDEWGEVQTPTTATSDAIIGVAVRRGGGR